MDAMKSIRINNVIRGRYTDMILPNSVWNHNFVAALEALSTGPVHPHENSTDWNLDQLYVEEIFRGNQCREREFHTDPTYLRFHPQLNPLYRASLVQLMITTTRKFEFEDEVLHQAVKVVDRYLSQTTDVIVSQLDEIGVAALLLAYKNEFSTGPFFPLQGVCALMSLDPTELHRRVLKREVMIGMTLNWRLFSQSPFSYLRRFCVILQISQKLVMKIAKCVLERALLEVAMLEYLPSTIAMMALIMARSCASHTGSFAGSLPDSMSWISQLRITNDEGNLILSCLQTMQNILQQETVLRAVQFSNKRSSICNSVPESEDRYNTLLHWLNNEIDRQSNCLSRFHPRSAQDVQMQKLYTNYLEYLAFIPAILEFAAKIMLVTNPSVLSEMRPTNEEEILHEDSMLSTKTDREEDSSSDSSMSCDTSEADISLSDLTLLTEANISTVINGFLVGSISLSEESLQPNMADSVVYRYSDVYKYLVTFVPKD
jgi:hypothetical protein